MNRNEEVELLNENHQEVQTIQSERNKCLFAEQEKEQRNQEWADVLNCNTSTFPSTDPREINEFMSNQNCFREVEHFSLNDVIEICDTTQRIINDLESEDLKVRCLEKSKNGQFNQFNWKLFDFMFDRLDHVSAEIIYDAGADGCRSSAKSNCTKLAICTLRGAHA